MSQSLANAFEFCPRCGTAVAEVGSNPLSCRQPDCRFTYFFSPITAVAAIVQDEAGRVLFLRRGKDPGKGKLGLPGGFVDAGESLEDALVREILEETQLAARVDKYITSRPNIYSFQGVDLAVTDMFFHCTVASFEGLTAQAGEVSEFHLAIPSETKLAEMAFDSNRQALEFFLQHQGN